VHRRPRLLDARRSTTADELSRVLERFGLTLSPVREWPRLSGPRLDRWLRDRPADLIAPSLVLLVEQEGRTGAHWLAVARGVLCDSYTGGEWVTGFPGGEGPSADWRVREAWRVAAR
jgi:hypothetical protein